LGLRYGYRRAEARQRRQVDETVDRLGSTNAEVRSLRTEFRRLKAIETSTNALRDPVEDPRFIERGA
jgi:hypothetical protein